MNGATNKETAMADIKFSVPVNGVLEAEVDSSFPTGPEVDQAFAHAIALGCTRVRFYTRIHGGCIGCYNVGMNGATKKETNMNTLAIRLDDILDWGCSRSDDDVAAYEEAVAAEILGAYPGAQVTVQCKQVRRQAVCVTTRDENGKILTDAETSKNETAIEEHVAAIAGEVWESGSFWS